MSAMLFALLFPRAHLTFPLNEMYGYSRLCDRLRSSAIIWQQLSLRSSTICDNLPSFAILWKPALNKLAAILKILQCAGCNIENIAVCRVQLLKISQSVLGNLMFKAHKTTAPFAFNPCSLQFNFLFESAILIN